MEEKHDLADILNELTKAMDNPTVEIIRSSAIDTLGIDNPIAGVTAGIVDKFLSEYRIYKLDCLLKCLSTKLNLETRKNELYNYVTSSQDNAITVANLFSKAINAECPKVCFIYGLILANHISDNTKFTHNELIVCKALENATEYDLNNFKEIMEKHHNPISNEYVIILPEEADKAEKLAFTCEWAVYNRLFTYHPSELPDEEEDYGGKFTQYHEDKPASLLMEYIKEASQIWNYGE